MKSQKKIFKESKGHVANQSKGHCKESKNRKPVSIDQRNGGFKVKNFKLESDTISIVAIVICVLTKTFHLMKNST